jgi:hypothetical protein
LYVFYSYVSLIRLTDLEEMFGISNNMKVLNSWNTKQMLELKLMSLAYNFYVNVYFY